MITNEQVYERAMRMGIEGRCYPQEEIWDRATTAKDTPFRSHDRGVLFVCPHCNAPHLVPVNYNAGPMPKVNYGQL